jgi:hypothetical protein
MGVLGCMGMKTLRKNGIFFLSLLDRGAENCTSDLLYFVIRAGKSIL